MPAWISGAVHSRIPLPSFKTYGVLSVGLFLSAIVTCTLLSSVSVSSNQSSQISERLFPNKQPSTLSNSWFAWLWSNASDQDDDLINDAHEEADSRWSEKLYNAIRPKSDQEKTIKDEKPTTSKDKIFTLSWYYSLSKHYPGGWPTDWSQLPSYVAFLSRYSFFAWNAINFVSFLFILLARFIQRLVFGNLRVAERQNMRDVFWNYAFYKLIFVLGILNIQHLVQLQFWFLWFASFSFLRLMSQLSKDRFEYVAYSPNTSSTVHRKIIGLLVSIFTCSVLLFGFAIFVYNCTMDVNTLGFLLADCCQLCLRTSLIIIKYVFHLRDLFYLDNWENKSLYIYYLDLFIESSMLLLDLLHHCHMLIWTHRFPSMACLVLCMQMRDIVLALQNRWMRHKEFSRVTRNMDAMFPEVRYPIVGSQTSNSELVNLSPDRIAGSSLKSAVGVGKTQGTITLDEDANVLSNDSDDSSSPCAICWDSIVVGRKLPCSHIFHRSCLRSWLVQDSTCPTCRHVLNFVTTSTSDTFNIQQTNLSTQQQGAQTATPITRQRGASESRSSLVSSFPHRSNVFHFDGSQIASWLPSFSLNVTHPSSLAASSSNNPETVVDGEDTLSDFEIDYWTRQLLIFFPQMSEDVIRDAVRTTNSWQLVAEQIVDGTFPGLVVDDQDDWIDSLSRRLDQCDAEIVQSSQTTDNNDQTVENEAETGGTFSSSAPGAEASLDPFLQLSASTAATHEWSLAANEDKSEVSSLASFSESSTPTKLNLATSNTSSSSCPTSNQYSTSEVHLGSTESLNLQNVTSLNSQCVLRNRKVSGSKVAASSAVQSSSPKIEFSSSDDSSSGFSSRTFVSSASDCNAVFGQRFSKDPQERHMILQHRKAEMIESCRRSYLAKKNLLN